MLTRASLSSRSCPPRASCRSALRPVISRERVDGVDRSQSRRIRERRQQAARYAIVVVPDEATAIDLPDTVLQAVCQFRRVCSPRRWCPFGNSAPGNQSCHSASTCARWGRTNVVTACAWAAVCTASSPERAPGAARPLRAPCGRRTKEGKGRGSPHRTAGLAPTTGEIAPAGRGRRSSCARHAARGRRRGRGGSPHRTAGAEARAPGLALPPGAIGAAHGVSLAPQKMRQSKRAVRKPAGSSV